jgi:very-short-patch-repair endonuclease
MTDSKTHRLKPAILARARRLRHPQTPAEARLWAHLRSAQLAGVKFRRQHPIGSFIVDFCCPARRLVVEIDGDSHARQVSYDTERTAKLQDLGYRVLRFSNSEVAANLEGVVDVILAACQVGDRPSP